MKAWKLESSPVKIKVNMGQVPVEHLICYGICLRFQCPFQENLFFLLRVSDVTIWKKRSRCSGKWPCSTPPKFNMEPENDGFQEELPFLGTSF